MKNNIFILKEVNKEIINQLVNIYFSAFNKFNYRNWSFKDFSDLINNGSIVFYYRYNKIIVAFCIVRFNQDFAEIITIAVEDSYQKKEIGKNILNYIINSLDYNGNFIIEVADINTKAINFYKRFGFIKIGNRKNYYFITKGPKSGQKINATVMQLNNSTFQ